MLAVDADRNAQIVRDQCRQSPVEGRPWCCRDERIVRSERANLTVKHIQQRDNRVHRGFGRETRARTVPMPSWVKNAQMLKTYIAGVGLPDSC